jgi:hypothetical protein
MGSPFISSFHHSEDIETQVIVQVVAEFGVQVFSISILTGNVGVPI